MDEEKLAKALGLFSIGLGIAEIVAPGSLARYFGMGRRDGTVRLFGLRELANGVAILAAPRSPAWLWTRVLGDVLDLASLSGPATRSRHHRHQAQAALGAVAGVMLLDVIGALALSRRQQRRAWR